MSNKYQNLLSPIKVGNVVFKNRLTAAPSEPHFVGGSEPYPTEGLITHFANKAKDGAALVTCVKGISVPVKAEKFWESEGHGFDRYRAYTGDELSLAETLECSFSKLTEAVHFYGSRVSMTLRGVGMNVPPEYDVSPGIPHIVHYKGKHVSMVGEEIPADWLDGIAGDYALEAALWKVLGFDMVYLHMSYRLSLLGRFLSPLTNKRTDQYGGSLKNRARFPLMVADRIKQKCGKDFLIEASISGPKYSPDGLTLEDTIEYAKMFAGHIDLLHLRSGDQDNTHPTGFNLERTPFLYIAEAVKKSGADIAVVATGGFQDLDICEDVIASGKADFISMARSWISNPDYGRKAYEGRGEDVVPCIRCNKCHMSSWTDPSVSVCSVNPIWGFEHEIERMVEPPTSKKKVAVVGSGPAGMEAALVAAGRGHQVTLYEKSDTLGGLLKTSEYASFKWPLRDFKNYLIRQIEKSKVKVYLNTEATPEMLRGKGYDAVLAAVGAEPIVPDISGVDGKNVVFAQDVYGNEAALAEKVVVIGGGEAGVETGMHLAEKGHKVTVLEMGDMLAPDAAPIHFYTMFRDAWERLENFEYILQARCSGIAADKVTYIDKDGAEHAIEAGNVVIAVGFKPKTDLALEFYGVGARFFMIGDCNGAGNVQKVMRSAFSTASML